MADKPDDVPSLEELGSGAEMPEYWTTSTTITVDRWVKASLDEHRDGRPWGQFLEQLRREHADPITINDVGELADRLDEELGQSGLAYDDVKQACAAAIRDELGEAMQR